MRKVWFVLVLGCFRFFFFEFLSMSLSFSFFLSSCAYYQTRLWSVLRWALIFISTRFVGYLLWLYTFTHFNAASFIIFSLTVLNSYTLKENLGQCFWEISQLCCFVPHSKASLESSSGSSPSLLVHPRPNLFHRPGRYHHHLAWHHVTSPRNQWNTRILTMPTHPAHGS